MLDNKKHPLTSKTLWVNALMAVFGFVLAYKPELNTVLNESNILIIMSVINIILRAITKDKLAIE